MRISTQQDGHSNTNYPYDSLSAEQHIPQSSNTRLHVYAMIYAMTLCIGVMQGLQKLVCQIIMQVGDKSVWK